MPDEGETPTTVTASRDFQKLVRQVAAFRDIKMQDVLDEIVAPFLANELRRLAAQVVDEPPVMVNDIDAGD